MTLLMAVCLECLGEGGWVGHVSAVDEVTRRSVRVWADCPECAGKGWKPEEVPA